MWFTQSRIDKSRQELESISRAIDEMNGLLESIDEKLKTGD
jgi:hypothetical protein